MSKELIESTNDILPSTPFVPIEPINDINATSSKLNDTLIFLPKMKTILSLIFFNNTSPPQLTLTSLYSTIPQQLICKLYHCVP
jgi:hypothetical protein